MCFTHLFAEVQHIFEVITLVCSNQCINYENKTHYCKPMYKLDNIVVQCKPLNVTTSYCYQPLNVITFKDTHELKITK